MSCIIVSGGFDPIHVGHLDMLKEASKYADKLIVILNNSQFLIRKKGFEFMPEKERKQIIQSIKYVDEVVTSIDRDDSVNETIKEISKKNKILYFANGGDRRSPSDIRESKTCKDLNIEMIFGVGGGKIQSSSKLVNPIFLKPWGSYKELSISHSYKLKEITILPGESISLQKHFQREEYWILIEGTLEIQVGDVVSNYQQGNFLHIPKRSLHRALNRSKKISKFIELQVGKVLSEDDIERFKDKYGRI